MPEITQEQLDKLTADAAKAKDVETLTQKLQEKDKEIEDVRMEVLTPEYTAFLDSLGQGEKTPKEEKPPKEGEDEFAKLTPRQIYERAKNDAIKTIDERQTKVQKDAQADRKKKTDAAILAFSKEHDDFETFRPIMYGLSLDPKYADYTLAQLYDKAKDHVARISGTPPKEKNKGGKGNEKPGGGGTSFTNDELKKMSNEAIAQKALEEMKAEFGEIPRA